MKRLCVSVGLLLLGCRGSTPATDDETGTTTGDGDGDGTPDPIMLMGSVQKGPLIVGSSVQVSPIDELGAPTGELFATQTTNDLGEFSVASVPQGDVFIEGNGYFYNELLGTVSAAPLTLRAYHRLAAGGSGSRSVSGRSGSGEAEQGHRPVARQPAIRRLFRE